MCLKEKIYNLINLHQEGPYWDFKREWYCQTDKSSLLHDIICMANNLVNHDAYIIIGVDEENGYSIKDVSNRNNRRTTQNLTDFLRNIKFAGEFRPTVTVEELEYQDGLIDVIVIHNSNNTPFFLRETTHGINQNNIFVRLQDSNTPKDKSADYHDVEMLWKKRFGLFLDPIDKVKIFLKSYSDWVDSPSNDSIRYYKSFPEYTIEINYPSEDERTGYEYYLFAQIDTTPHWADILVKYHQTVLIEEVGIFLDGFRAFSVAPDFSGFSINKFHLGHEVTYRYFEKDSLAYLLYSYFLQSDSVDRFAMSRFEECILFFENHDEHEMFIEFAKENWIKRDDFISHKIDLPNFEPVDGYDMECFKKDYLNVQILRMMFSKYIDLIKI